MKHIKKLASLLLAMVMVLSLSVTAFAATDTIITAPSGSTRTYDVYQIFTGDLSADGNTLSNIKWGQNGTDTPGEAVADTVLNALNAVVNTASDTDKLAVIEKYADLKGTPVGTVKDGEPLTVPTGYYLIKDNGPVGDGESYSLYVVQVVGPTTISPKVGTTTSDKKVDDKNDSNTSEDDTTWQDSADYDIGDAVPFKLSATIDEKYDNYTNGYKLTFHDEQSDGLSFNASSVVVKVDGTEILTGYELITNPADDCTFEVRFANLKDITSVHAGSVITVEYTSTLTGDAVVFGSMGNPDTSHVTYTNNPNDEQAGENGSTPDDTVIVFTYKAVVNKVDSNGDALEGAGFTLYKHVGRDWAAVGDEITGVTTFTFSGLDDGWYKLVETTTPDGYNTIAPIYFLIEAKHDENATEPTLTKLTAVITDENGTKQTELKDGEQVDMDLGTVDTTAGSISTDVVNLSGAELPETGGMGTTIFYILGGALVVVAVVLLVTKKRMNAKG